MPRLHDSTSDEFDASLPPRLADDLLRSAHVPRVPPAVDSAIRNNARAYFAAQRRQRRLLRWGGAGAAAAAAVAFVAIRFAASPENGPQLASQNAPVRLARAEDVDRNGTVDILDAFAVARGINAKSAPQAWDVNGDGTVDRRDVDRIATEAVSAARAPAQPDRRVTP